MDTRTVKGTEHGPGTGGNEVASHSLDFEPRVIAFCCNWCSYAGADLAGASRFQYPPNIRIIRVMCTGRIEPSFVLNAFREGWDGVMILGCHPGECHYITGNLNAEKQMKIAFELCEALGIENGRMRLEWVSASEGRRFQEIVTDFIEEVRKLGPSKIGKGRGGGGGK